MRRFSRIWSGLGPVTGSKSSLEDQDGLSVPLKSDELTSLLPCHSGGRDADGLVMMNALLVTLTFWVVSPSRKMQNLPLAKHYPKIDVTYRSLQVFGVLKCLWKC